MQRCPSILYFCEDRTKGEQVVSHTERDILQLPAEFLTLSNRHRLFGRVLHQIELYVNREVILVRAGLPGDVLHVNMQKRRCKEKGRTGKNESHAR